MIIDFFSEKIDFLPLKKHKQTHSKSCLPMFHCLLQKLILHEIIPLFKPINTSLNIIAVTVSRVLEG